MLPELHPGTAPGQTVRVSLRVLQSTPKAFRVAVPFSGPDSVAPASAWVPRSQAHSAGAGDGFRVSRFVMPAWLYRRLRQQLVEGVGHG